MKNKANKNKVNKIERINRKIFVTQISLIVSLALFLGIAGICVNISFEAEKRDQNLQNIAETIAQSPLLDERINNPDDAAVVGQFSVYLDSLKDMLDSIDVISIVSSDNIRLYHSNHELIGTEYDGTLPEFGEDNREYYTASDSGPSGTQRRAYAAIYDDSGDYLGFVMAIMLTENIKAETMRIFLVFLLITMAAVLLELLISAELSRSIKKSLHGYEPDVFSAMYQIRDDILEALKEGVLAVDKDGIVQFINKPAVSMLNDKTLKAEDIVGKPLADTYGKALLSQTLESGKQEFGVQDSSLKRADILIDRIPIKEREEIIGAVAILHNREEYTKLMEDLAGTRYLVDSMRANNHDFTNKLHVILGLIQMEMYDEATAYIENITIVQRTAISKIMSAIGEPAIAALLIGKTARASELNVKFTLKDWSRYSKADLALPSEMLVTVIGNLIDNAFEAMNINGKSYENPKELQLGIYSKPGALLITAEDTGAGIPEKDKMHIFENGFSTKGDARGTGLYQVMELVTSYGGTISFESQEGAGTAFTVSFNAVKDSTRE